MVERESHTRLSEILKATSDPSRRKLLTLLVQHGAMRVTDLAAHFDMSLNSVSKHIKTLESAGLVNRRTEWREHLIDANLEPVHLIEDWFRDLRSIWEMRLDALGTALTEKENPMTDSDLAELSLTVSRHIPATPQRVFDAWLSPEWMSRFMVPKEGVTIGKAEADATVGGRFTLLMIDGETEIPHAGEYLEITRHSRIKFSWESPFSIDGSTVTLDFSPADGGTDVTLTHVKFATRSARDSHNGGWNAILDKLRAEI